MTRIVRVGNHYVRRPQAMPYRVDHAHVMREAIVDHLLALAVLLIVFAAVLLWTVAR